MTIVVKSTKIDGKEYVDAADFEKLAYELSDTIAQAEKIKEELDAAKKCDSHTMDLKAELDDTREALKHAHKENEELSYKLKVAENKLRDSTLKSEFQKGQIDAFQFCMITATKASEGITD